MTLLTSICIADLDFTVLRPIRSLPPFHGARWSALMRNACTLSGVNMEAALGGLLPWRMGTEPIATGDILGLRIVLPLDSICCWPALLQCLRHGQCGKGEFQLGHSLRLSEIRCALSGSPQGDTLCGLVPLAQKHIFAQTQALCRSEIWSLRFNAPLRLSRPAGGRKEGHRFCDENFFANTPSAFAYLVNKIRNIQTCTPPFDVDLQLGECSLQWQDMRYNAQRRMALGGVTGEMTLHGKPSEALATRLALGQYTGVGKNPRFGLGYYSLVFPVE